jgi:hypothetical protein
MKVIQGDSRHMGIFRLKIKTWNTDLDGGGGNDDDDNDDDDDDDDNDDDSDNDHVFKKEKLI